MSHPDPPVSGCIIGMATAEYVVSPPDLHPYVLGEKRVDSQRADPSMAALWDEVLPVDTISDVARVHFVQVDLLVRKWVPCGDFVGEAVFQVVVPSNFHDVVLQTANDSCGHLGIRRSHVPHYFFWPQLKLNVSKYVIKNCENLEGAQARLKKLYDLKLCVASLALALQGIL